MPTRRSKNGRFSRQTKTRRRSKPAVKVTTVAQQVIIANALTRGVAGTNLIPFLTEGWLKEKTAGSDYGSGNSWTFSASELVGGALGGNFGMSPEWQEMGISEAVMKNLRANGMQMLATVILTPIAFRMAKKVLNKPIILPANRLLKSAGIKEVKV